MSPEANMLTVPTTPSIISAATLITLISAPLFDTDLYYKSKWGKITIFISDNYQLFEQTCRTTLVVTGAWNIINRTKAQPPSQNRALL